MTTSAEGESVVELSDRRQTLRSALKRLPDKQRRCVLLRIDADLSFREIGQAVGCSTVSARVNYHHALRALRNALSEGVSERATGTAVAGLDRRTPYET